MSTIITELTTGDILIEGEFEIGSGGRLPNYEGSYYIMPKVEKQVIETKNKSMTEDITINAIPFSEVGNPSGGNTINIAYIL